MKLKVEGTRKRKLEEEPASDNNNETAANGNNEGINNSEEIVLEGGICSQYFNEVNREKREIEKNLKEAYDEDQANK